MLVLSFFTLSLPLFGAVMAGCFSKHLGPKVSVRLPVACTLLAALAVLPIGLEFVGTPMVYTLPLFDWLKFGDLNIAWSLYVDSKAMVMMGVVTLVSSAVHIYSLGYMKQDPGQVRFMAYLSLFTFMMLWLVMAGDLIQLFVGWEGVGLCSYLLIGFWFEKEGPKKAALKAFMVNRVGDFFLILGLVGIFWLYGSFSFDSLNHFSHPDRLHGWAPTTIGFLLLLGAMAKSAQIGFHVWLPDAMEGPTPVSALIHAATMVTAGIFLLLRFEHLLEQLPVVLNTIALVGGITAVFGSVMALAQRDLKRIIAYSTCSQLGYMVLAIGVSAYGAALFHLTTHAFFKALLFLGAGSVIHVFGGEKDITRMGGLGLRAPLTYAAMLVGLLSLTGMPYFAGFFSKDMILEAAYHHKGFGAGIGFIMGLVAAFVTSLYAMRLMLRVFHRTAFKEGSFKESPVLFLIPLGILIILSLLVGYMIHAEWGRLILEIRPQSHSVASYMVIGTSLLGMFVGYMVFGFLPHLSRLLQEKNPALHGFFLNQAYIDRLYRWLWVKPHAHLSAVLAYMDTHYLDHFGPMGIARATKRLHGILVRFQTGYLFHYVLLMLVGLVGILLYYWMV